MEKVKKTASGSAVSADLLPWRLGLLDGDPQVHLATQATLQALASGWRLENCRTARQALDRFSRTPPDVVLMELSLPDLSGIACTRKLKALVPELPIILFTARTEAENILLALMAGACGYLIKPAAAEDLLGAITNALSGWPALCRRAERQLVDRLRQFGYGCATRARLTCREQEVMACLLSHRTDKEIANALHLTTGTVHVHLAHIFKKLHTHTRDDALQKFLGLLPRL